MSNLLHCDIGEVVQYLREQNKGFYADRLSDCLQHSNTSLVKLTIENQKLRVELREIKDGFEGCCLACEPVGEMNKKLREERDEARRMYLASTCSDDEIIPEMKRKGWDCFKENTDYLQDLG